MPSYADLAADLLTEAGSFFVRISQNRPDILPQMEDNAATFQRMAELIKNDPSGSVEHLTHGEMAARLLEDAALFFESVAKENPPIAEQMIENAVIFRQIGEQVRTNPTQDVPEDSK